MRFLLVYSPENENRAYVQFLVDVKDPKKISELIGVIQKRLDENFPDANTIAKKFLLGPGAGGRIQARFSGPDSAVLRQLGLGRVFGLDRPARRAVPVFGKGLAWVR